MKPEVDDTTNSASPARSSHRIVGKQSLGRLLASVERPADDACGSPPASAAVASKCLHQCLDESIAWWADAILEGPFGNAIRSRGAQKTALRAFSGCTGLWSEGVIFKVACSISFFCFCFNLRI